MAKMTLMFRQGAYEFAEREAVRLLAEAQRPGQPKKDASTIQILQSFRDQSRARLLPKAPKPIPKADG